MRKTLLLFSSISLAFIIIVIGNIVIVAQVISNNIKDYAVQNNATKKQVKCEKIQEIEKSLSPPVRIEGERYWTIEERMKYYNIRGISLAIIDDYQIKCAKGYGISDVETKTPVTNNTAFQTASINKSINAVGILILAERGKINLNADINTILKSWKFPYDKKFGSTKINTLNLLSHTAGLSTSGFKGYPNTKNIPTLVEILDGKKPANSDAVRSVALPNTEFRYSGGGIVITQVMISDITNLSYQEFIAENIFEPIGMDQSFYEINKTNDSRLASGHWVNGDRLKNKYHIYPELAPAGLWSTPTDIAKFIIEIQKAFDERSDKLISKKYAELMLQPLLENQQNGLGVFIEDKKGTKYFQHGGSNEGFRGQYYASMQNGKGFVILTNSENYDIIPEITRGVATVYDWDNFYNAIPRKIIKLAESDLKPFVGSYIFESGTKIEIKAEKDRLFLIGSSGNKYELFAESENSFFFKIADEQIEFVSTDKEKNLRYIKNGKSNKAIRK